MRSIRGDHWNKFALPAKHGDGCFVVSPTRFERDYVRIRHERDLLGHLEKGLKLRMSNPDAGISAPSLIEPGQIYRPVRL